LQQLVVIPHPSLVDITESDDLVRRVVLYPVDDSPEEELATGATSDLVSPQITFRCRSVDVDSKM
jgi:hypothetical protein